MPANQATTSTTSARPPLPEGVVTFLFSDIEGSTRLLEAHRGAFGAALARHHELLAAVIVDRDGVVFETIGDAVYGAFGDPTDAVVAAVAIQRAMAAEPWGELADLRVRISVHTGPVETRGHHYYGPALFECARIQALVHGGQVVVSEATAASATSSLPDDIVLQTLGRQRLKDLTEPMEVMQVDAAGVPNRFPPLRASVTIPTNLPHDTTSFVGRVDDLARLDELIAQHRLVTLLGPGGTGKTRLAMAAAARQLDRFPDGVWLVELAPVASPGLVIAELADVWGLRAGEGSSLEEVVRRYLSTRHLLLVVDNCEHVREAAADVLGGVLRTAPGVAILATSRETLGVPGEVGYRVSTLPLPTDEDHATESDAVRLFLDRVRTVRPDLEVSRDDLRAIVRACRRLEGMPLGLELAAARIRTITPAELAERLDATFRTLGVVSKTALPHQRTLEATLDWSYGLLTSDERWVFRRLAVYAGSFDVAAAEAVCAGAAPEDVFDHLDSLVDKSLLLPIDGPTTRFRLLEPIRQYAQEQLELAGEGAIVRDAHARHYAKVVATAAPHTRGPDQMTWEWRLDAEYDNIRAALAHLLATADTDRYLQICFDLFIYWMHLGMHVEGIAATLAGLERAPSTSQAARLVQAWFVVSGLGAEITDPVAIGHARRGLALARATGDPNLVGRMELQLGAAINHSTTDPEYLEHLLEGRRLLETHPEPHWWEPEWERGLLNLILAAYLPGDDERVLEHVQVALASFEAAGDQALLAATLGDSLTLWGRADEAWLMGNLERSVEILGSMKVPYWFGHALLTLGSIRGAQGAHDIASARLAEAAGHLEDMGDLNCWASALRRGASADAARGLPDLARAALARSMEALPLLPMPEVHVPRSLDAAAEVLLAAGRHEEAAFALGRAIATELPVPSIFAREPTQGRVRARLEERLGEEEATRRIAEGTATDPDAALGTILGWLRTG